MKDDSESPGIDPPGEAHIGAGMNGMVRDITDRTRDEEELHNYLMRLEELVKNRTGELKTMNARLLAEIAERRQAEEALQLAAAYSRTLIETSLDPLVTIDPAGKITDVNSATERATGLARERLIGTDFSDYFTEPDKAKAGYEKVFARGMVTDYPLTIQHLSGTCMDVLYNASVYRDERGAVIGIFAAARDITERKRAEEKIKELLAEKELLLKEVHHRIKNNMNTMMSLLMLQSKVQKDPSAVAAFMDARSRLQSMGVMYDKLYCSDNYREMSIGDYLVPLVNEIADQFPHRDRVTIETDMADFVLHARLLPPLGLIVNELITNAMKYAFTGRDRGVIKVSASLKDTHATLVFEDDGNGIPEAVNLGRPTGFGLQLVELLAKQLHGSIRLERHEGARFIVEFQV